MLNYSLIWNPQIVNYYFFGVYSTVFVLFSITKFFTRNSNHVVKKNIGLYLNPILLLFFVSFKSTVICYSTFTDLFLFFFTVILVINLYTNNFKKDLLFLKHDWFILILNVLYFTTVLHLPFISNIFFFFILLEIFFLLTLSFIFYRNLNVSLSNKTNMVSLYFKKADYAKNILIVFWLSAFTLIFIMYSTLFIILSNLQQLSILSLIPVIVFFMLWLLKLGVLPFHQWLYFFYNNLKLQDLTLYLQYYYLPSFILWLWYLYVFYNSFFIILKTPFVFLIIFFLASLLPLLYTDFTFKKFLMLNTTINLFVYLTFFII